jgi:integrase
MDIDEIRSGDINEWLRSLKDMEPKTVHNLYKELRAIVNWHRRQQDWEPVKWYAELPRLKDEERRWFTPQEMMQLIDASTGQDKVLLRLVAFTGMRPCELSGLRVGDIDFARGFARVQRSTTYGIDVPRIKNGKKRTVYMDSMTQTMLKDFIAGERRTGRVFQSKHGRWLDMHEVTRSVVVPLCKRLGIEPGGLYSFRHGRVSLMQAQRLPADYITKQIGHSSLKTTSGYTHFSEVQMQQIGRAIAELWSKR